MLKLEEGRVPRGGLNDPIAAETNLSGARLRARLACHAVNHNEAVAWGAE